MSHPSAPPVRRPRPGPGRPSTDAARPAPPTSAALPATPPKLPSANPSHRGVVTVGSETLRAPGFAAFFHRHPKATQRGGFGAVASGIVLFVIAGVTTPLAIANTGAPRSSAHKSSTSAVHLYREALPPKVAPVPATTLAQAPVHSSKPAPVSHGVISGLAANGIPQVALNAYRVAAARMANVEPSCGIDWALLAGIGREESDHGQFAGSVLHADGVSTPKIIGPALDGKHWDLIPAPGNGLQLDGDPVYAHALGPMQFIPSTWAIYGTDATGDGKADIFNINDAALGAARYLCAAGGNLRTHDGQVRAVEAYNHNDQYLAQVLALADAYRRGIPISGIPVGITTGALPKVTDTGYIPPANPGAPTAAQKTTKTAAHHPKTSTKSGGKSSSPTKARPSSTTKAAPSTGASSPKPSGSTSGGSKTTPAPSPTCNAVQSLLGCVG